MTDESKPEPRGELTRYYSRGALGTSDPKYGMVGVYYETREVDAALAALQTQRDAWAEYADAGEDLALAISKLMDQRYETVSGAEAERASQDMLAGLPGHDPARQRASFERLAQWVREQHDALAAKDAEIERLRKRTHEVQRQESQRFSRENRDLLNFKRSTEAWYRYAEDEWRKYREADGVEAHSIFHHMCFVWMVKRDQRLSEDACRARRALWNDLEPQREIVRRERAKLEAEGQLKAQAAEIAELKSQIAKLQPAAFLAGVKANDALKAEIAELRAAMRAMFEYVADLGEYAHPDGVSRITLNAPHPEEHQVMTRARNALAGRPK